MPNLSNVTAVILAGGLGTPKSYVLAEKFFREPT